MRNYLLLLLLFFLISPGNAQDDSIRNEIFRHPPGKSEIISRARSYLVDRFLDGDIQKVGEITDYLLEEVQDEDYIAFYPQELWLIWYWTGNYEKIMESVGGIDTFDFSAYQTKILPPEDLLFAKIKKRTRDFMPTIESDIYRSSLGDEQKDFLAMHLHYMAAGEGYDAISQDDLNAQADGFLYHYPGSRYETFTRKYIRFVSEPSKWGIAFEFFSGYGILTDKLGDFYTNNVPLGVAFDIYYGNFALFLRDYIGFGRTKLGIPFSAGWWPEGSQVRLFLPEASLGYTLVNNNLLSISPFGGISGLDISPTENDLDNIPALEEVELAFGLAYTAGINIDIKLGKGRRGPLTKEAENNYGFMRIRYGYNFARLDRKYDGFSGNMHYITLGFGGFARKIKRQY